MACPRSRPHRYRATRMGLVTASQPWDLTNADNPDPEIAKTPGRPLAVTDASPSHVDGLSQRMRAQLPIAATAGEVSEIQSNDPVQSGT
jgi:hypothetical protein